jgi:hypothetical protein
MDKVTATAGILLILAGILIILGAQGSLPPGWF